MKRAIWIIALAIMPLAGCDDDVAVGPSALSDHPESAFTNRLQSVPQPRCMVDRRPVRARGPLVIC